MEASQQPERVLFCEAAVKGSGGYFSRRVRAFGYMLALGIVFGLTLLAVYQFLPGPYAFVLAAGVTLAFLVAAAIADHVGKDRMARARAALAPLDESARVRCHGKATRVARLMGIEPLEDRMFEPRVFLAVGSVPGTRTSQIVQIVAGAVLLIASIWLQWHFLHRVGMLYVDFIVAVGGAMAIGSMVFPTYLRIVPGRVDVMECGLLGRKILHVRRIDLRTRKVIVDLNRRMIGIDSVPKYEHIAFAAIWDRWGFAHAVLMASISTHTPPPLPDDQLVG